MKRVAIRTLKHAEDRFSVVAEIRPVNFKPEDAPEHLIKLGNFETADAAARQVDRYVLELAKGRLRWVQEMTQS